MAQTTARTGNGGKRGGGTGAGTGAKAGTKIGTKTGARKTVRTAERAGTRKPAASKPLKAPVRQGARKAMAGTARDRKGAGLLDRRALLGGTILFGIGVGLGLYAGRDPGAGAAVRHANAPPPPRRPPPGSVTLADVPDARQVSLSMPMAEGASADVLALPSAPSRVVLPDPQIVTARAPTPSPASDAAVASAPPAAPTPAAKPAHSARPMAQAVALPTPALPALPALPGTPPWLAHAVAVPDPGRRPMVTIVIDDLGLDRHRTAAVAALPGPLTLSFMAYADALPRQTATARAFGHELMVHMPMQPSDSTVDPGPGALMVGQSGAEIRRRLEQALDRFAGHVGFNNHMGSRFTAEPAGMRVVMEVARRRGLLFLDSRTSGGSVAPRLAASTGVPFVERAIFLDHDPARGAIDRQLAALESVAGRHGHAVAIGHPRDATIAALQAWLPSLAGRGLALVPASAIPRFARAA